MSLLREIQVSLLEERSDLGPILLKLRFLAARLGSDILEDWVQHEMNGYPEDVSVPDYRKASISYSGTFSNMYQTLNKVTIPEYLIKQHAGEQWLHIDIRDPLSVIDAMVARRSEYSKSDQRYGVSTGNLKLLLQDKIYDGLPMIEMYSEFGPGAFIGIQSTVRAKVLELTLELEKIVPDAANIVISNPSEAPRIDSDSVSNVMQQIINYGNVTNVQTSGDNATVNIQVAQGNKGDLIKALISGGFPEEDALEIASIIESEEPDQENKTFGRKAQAWIGDKVARGTAAAWKAGLDVATDVLTKAALKYYGLDS